MVLTLVLVGSTLLTLLLALACYARRDAPGGLAGFVCMLAAAGWSASFTFHHLGLAGPMPLFWIRALFSFAALVPAAYFAFAVQHTGYATWLGRPVRVLLAALPLTAWAMLWAPWFEPLWLAGQLPFTGEAFQGGRGYQIYMAYSYVLLAMGVAVLIGNAARTPRLQRRQSVAILLGSLAPMAGNVATATGLSPVPTVDLTVPGFAISTVVFLYALYHEGLFELVPLARDLVVEGMEHGVLVLDSEDRVLDINPAARELLSLEPHFQLGQRAQTVLRDPGERDAIAGEVAGPLCHELVVERRGKRRHIDITINPLRNSLGNTAGRLVVLHDITRLKETEQALREQLAANQALQDELHERSIRDALTGLYNRRFLDETLRREAQLAWRSGRPLSVVLIDLDNFKAMNDTHGHAVGDRLLIALGKLLRGSTRGTDAACRYGGEEFVVLMPGATPEAAAERVDTWRRLFEKLTASKRLGYLRSTFSAGVAGSPAHARDAKGLLAAADTALYAAKTSGRNRVCIARKDGPRQALRAAQGGTSA